MTSVSLVNELEVAGTGGNTGEVLRQDEAKPTVFDIFGYDEAPLPDSSQACAPRGSQACAPVEDQSTAQLRVANKFIDALLETSVSRVANWAVLVSAATSWNDAAKATATEPQGESSGEPNLDAAESRSTRSVSDSEWAEQNQTSVEVQRRDDDAAAPSPEDPSAPPRSIADIFAPLEEERALCKDCSGTSMQPVTKHLPAQLEPLDLGSTKLLPTTMEVEALVEAPQLATASEVPAELSSPLEEGLLRQRSQGTGAEAEELAEDDDEGEAATKNEEPKSKQPHLAACVGVGHAFLFSVSWLMSKSVLESLDRVRSDAYPFAAVATLILARGVVGTVFSLVLIKRAGEGCPEGCVGPASTVLRVLLVARSTAFLAAMCAFYVALSGLRLGDGSALWLSSPLISMLIGVFVFGDSFNLGARLAVLLAIPGVVFIVQPESIFGATTSPSAISTSFNWTAFVDADVAASEDGSDMLSMAIMACATALKSVAFALTQALDRRLSRDVQMLGFFFANLIGGSGYLVVSGAFLNALQQAGVVEYLLLFGISTLVILMQYMQILAIELDSASRFDLTQVFIVVLGMVWDHLLFDAEAAPLTFVGTAMLVAVPLALTDSAEKVLQNCFEQAGYLQVECLLCALTAPKNLALLAIALTSTLVLAAVAHGSPAGLYGAL